MNSQAGTQSTPDYSQPTSPSSSSSRAFAKARRTRHRVDAGEPRGCFNSPPVSVGHSVHHQPFYSPASQRNLYPMKMLQEFISPNQLLLREMLQRKQGYEDECAAEPRINGCKKRKLYQPQKQDIEIAEVMEDDEYEEEPSLPREISAAAAASAPLTRQLLTERQQRDQVISPMANHAAGLPSPPHYLHQWKENFKTQLITNISELVDRQFEILFPKQPLHQHQQQHINRAPTPNSPHEHPAPKVFNGGSVEAFPRYLHPNKEFTNHLINLAQHRDIDEPLSLVVTPKKKRHKVTDTRLTPRAVSKLLSDYPPSPSTSPLPTSVAIPNPSLPLFAPYAPFIYQKNSPDFQPASSDSGETNSFDFTPGHSSTLTPMHLRKAKLMFFWVRYPSSSVLKMYFPDIKFNKNNTAQLVKWFSNFREFYYIQMEKYARQALSEGVKNAEDIHVSVENELYRVLNLHYNRNNHIEVPTNFRYVVEQTLREFFKAIQTGKDSEQSWKKAIYKIIARLDDPVPEYFKSPNFLEQLE